MVKLYVEGGGVSNALRTACRKGFRQFLEKAGLSGRMPRIIACGSRNDAYDSFCTALRQNTNELSLLLIDSEARVKKQYEPWTHLHQTDNWQQPRNAGNDDVYLMAQCMETWLIADAEAVANYFGQGFNLNNLPHHSDLELVGKESILDSLHRATHQTTAGSYNKDRHSFQILGQIDPGIVRERCSQAKRFITFLLDTL